MKVLMIDALVGSDYSECLCSALKNTGTDIALIVPENKSTRDTIEFPLLKWLPTKDKQASKLAKIFKFLFYLIRVLNNIRQNKVDIVHYQFFRRKSEVLFFYLLKLLKVKLVYTAHNVMPHENGRFDFKIQSFVLKTATAIIAHTQFIKNKLIETFEIENEKIYVIAHGNYDSQLPEKQISKKQARKNLSIRQDENVILFFGAVKAYKGLDLLLDAFEIAASQNQNLRLVIAGSPDTEELKNKYANKINQLKSKNRIIHNFAYVPTEKVADYFLAADIIALPYKNIYHSGIIHLTFSYGRPFVATDVGDFREMAEEGKCGKISPENSATSFAETLLDCFADKELLEKMGKYCKKISDTKYSWNDIAKKTRDLYENLLSK